MVIIAHYLREWKNLVARRLRRVKKRRPSEAREMVAMREPKERKPRSRRFLV